jgi:hypothetical protein
VLQASRHKLRVELPDLDLGGGPGMSRRRLHAAVAVAGGAAVGVNAGPDRGVDGGEARDGAMGNVCL